MNFKLEFNEEPESTEIKQKTTNSRVRRRSSLLNDNNQGLFSELTIHEMELSRVCKRVRQEVNR